MSTVKEILQNKTNKHVWSSFEDSSVIDAIRLMSVKNIGALVIFDKTKRLSGVLTERDYLRNVALKNRTSKDTLVKDIMNTKLITVEPNQTADHCMDLMVENKIRHLPVLDQGEVVGVVSMGDIIKKVIHDREFLLDQFIYYVTGSENTDTSSIYNHCSYSEN